MKKQEYTIAVVGASGLVGSTFLKILEEYGIPVGELRVFASERSKGKEVCFRNREYPLQVLDEHSFDGADFALFSAGAEVARSWALIAERAGCTVIDNSSAFRTETDIALVVPEINAADIAASPRRIIANPNCSTITVSVPLMLVRDLFGIRKLVYSTYQSVSGSGMKGIFDLEMAAEGYPCDFYPFDISRTCIPLIGSPLPGGDTDEEIKMIRETRKILHLPETVEIEATCVRVPIRSCHGVSVYAETERPVDLSLLKEAVHKQKNLILYDDPFRNEVPTSLAVEDTDRICAGRFRLLHGSTDGLLMYCTADNIRKGAASNAVQILKLLL